MKKHKKRYFLFSREIQPLLLRGLLVVRENKCLGNRYFMFAREK